MTIATYLTSDTSKYIQLFAQHAQISFIALFISIIIAVPLGYFCTKNKYIKAWILKMFQVLRIIPSLAILILFIPILGTGMKPAIVALVVLGIPPILLNTVTAFIEVPPAIIESSYAMGMTDRQILQKIKIPLAIPIIMLGIKTSLIEIIASATLASKIGAGGLGDLIFTGLGLNRMDLIVIGGLLVAILALMSTFAIEILERKITKYRYLK